MRLLPVLLSAALELCLIPRVCLCRVYRVLFRTENPGWLARPHQLEMLLAHPSRPVEVVRQLCPCLCLFQKVQAMSVLRVR